MNPIPEAIQASWPESVASISGMYKMESPIPYSMTRIMNWRAFIVWFASSGDTPSR